MVDVAARVQALDPAPLATAARPVSGWRRMLRDWWVVGWATGACHGLGAATSLLLRALLSPAQMGVWQALKLLLSWGNYANLGASKGAARDFTVALGRGDTSAARRGLNLAFTVNTISSLLFAAVIVGVGVWIAVAGNGRWSGAWAAGLMAVGGLAVVSRYVTFQVTILRCKQAFVSTSQLAILEATLTLVVCGLATWRWGLPGLYGGTFVVLLGAVLFLRRHRAVQLDWAWDAAEIRRLIAVGGPILLASTVSSLFRSLDKLMILAYLSDREFQLGCYSLALMVSVQLYGLGNMLAIVMGPRYGEKYGRSGSRRQVALLAARATELQAAAMALPAAVAIVAAPPILSRILPDYQSGLAPLVWLVPGVVALLVALPASQYLIAVNRQGRALLAVVIATAVAALGNHLALTLGYGVIGVAAATAGGYLLYLLLLVAVSIWSELEGHARLRYLAMLGLTLGPTLGLALLLERLWPEVGTDWARLAAKLAAIVLVWALVVAAAWQLGGWQAELKHRNTQAE